MFKKTLYTFHCIDHRSRTNSPILSDVTTGKCLSWQPSVLVEPVRRTNAYQRTTGSMKLIILNPNFQMGKRDQLTLLRSQN